MSAYKDAVNREISMQVKELSRQLPDPARQFLLHKAAGGSSERTLLSYSQNLLNYFRYLCENNSYFAKKRIPDITVDDLADMTTEDASEFLVSLRTGKLSTQKHYRTTLNQFYKFLVQTDRIRKNPFEMTSITHKEAQNIHFLDEDEQKMFMEGIENQRGLTGKQKAAAEKNQVRDTAICAIFLSTGIRVSELVGLDLSDIDLKHHRFTVTRKGAREHTEDVYMSDSAEERLLDYLDIRETYAPAPSDKAVFLTEGRLVRKDGNKERVKEPGHRISVKTVERLVKKYVEANVPEKAGKITPHKLRTSFAENVLRKTGNVELTKDLLGHRNIASTTHYVTTTEEEKEKARNITES